jgi:hypothetical protein
VRRFFNREQWWEVARAVRPSLSREEFEAMWEANQRRKDQRAALRASLRFVPGGKP